MFNKGGNMSKFLKQAQKMKDNMEKAQNELSDMRIETSSADKMVEIVVDGNKNIISLHLNEALLSEDKDLIEDEYFRPHDTAVIGVPQKAPSGAIYRTESALHLLNRVKHITNEWVNNGHSKGANRHNVSATISIREHEWYDVGEWMWENRNSYNGLSVLPYDGGTYQQAPFEDCSKETYEAMVQSLKEIDLTKVVEKEDNTDLKGSVACAGGMCEVKFI